MASELVFPAIPQLIGGGKILPSPNQFYLTGEDRLRIVSANSLAGVSLKMQFRTANVQGDTVAHSEDHTPNTDRSVRVQDYAVGSGSLLNVTVFARTGLPVIGQTYVMVQLVRGAGAAAVVLGTLLAGYVTLTQALGFPGSPIENSLQALPSDRMITGTAPAAGAEIAETVPTGARWQLTLVKFDLVTSATVATRRSFLNITIGAVSRGQFVPSSSQLAGQSFQYLWSSNMPVIFDSGNGIVQQPFPEPLFLTAGQLLRSVTTGFQVDDQYAAPIFSVREWLEV